MKKLIEVEYPDEGSVWKYSNINYENNMGFFICVDGKMKSIEMAEFDNTIQPTLIADCFGEIGHRSSRDFKPDKNWTFYASNRKEFMIKQGQELINKNQVKLDTLRKNLDEIIRIL